MQHTRIVRTQIGTTRFHLIAIRSALAATLLISVTTISAQSPMTTVLSKPSIPTSPSLAAMLAQCDAPKLPLKLSAGTTLVSSKVVRDRLDGREISLRSYRFSRALDKVLPELERAGAVLHFEPPGDLRKLPAGVVWHGYNEVDGLDVTRELTCSRI